MYLFSRSTVMADDDGLAWAVGITEHAKRASGLDIGLWGQVWSPEFGRVAWTAFVPDLATLAAAGDAMNGDAAMTAEVAKGARTGPAGWTTRSTTSCTVSSTQRAAGRVRVVHQLGVCQREAHRGDDDRRRDRPAGGEDHRASRPCSRRTSRACTAVSGWISGYPDVAAMEAAQQAIDADDSLPSRSIRPPRCIPGIRPRRNATVLPPLRVGAAVTCRGRMSLHYERGHGAVVLHDGFRLFRDAALRFRRLTEPGSRAERLAVQSGVAGLVAGRAVMSVPFDSLRGSSPSGVVTPEDPHYEEAREVFNAMIVKRPAAIAGCETAGDVAASIAFARQQDLDIAVRGWRALRRRSLAV